MFNMVNAGKLILSVYIYNTDKGWLGLVIFALIIIVCIIIRQRSRYYQEIQDEEDGFSCLKKTPTYYQWNRTPPSCQKSSPINPEKESWEQRRNMLLKKYSAIQSLS